MKDPYYHTEHNHKHSTKNVNSKKHDKKLSSNFDNKDGGDLQTSVINADKRSVLAQSCAGPMAERYQRIFEKGQEMVVKKTEMAVNQRIKEKIAEEREALFAPQINKRSRKLAEKNASYFNEPIENRLQTCGTRYNKKKDRCVIANLGQELMECTYKPKINDISRIIVEENTLNPSNQDVHDKLFYRGIESQNIKKEENDIQFHRQHPFTPQINNGSQSSRVLNRQNTVDINRLAYTDKTKNKVMENKREYLLNYDEKTGQKLFTPKINMNRSVTPVKKGEKTWTEMEEFRKRKKEFVNKVKQIFNFIDKKHEGVIRIEKIDYANTEGVCISILTNILLEIIRHGRRQNFNGFYELILEKNLQEEVEQVFKAQDAELKCKQNPKVQKISARESFLDYKKGNESGMLRSKSSRIVRDDKYKKVEMKTVPEYTSSDMFELAVDKLHKKRMQGAGVNGSDSNFNKENLWCETNYISPNYRKLIKKQIGDN